MHCCVVLCCLVLRCVVLCMLCMLFHAKCSKAMLGYLVCRNVQFCVLEWSGWNGTEGKGMESNASQRNVMCCDVV